jgi:hypothetical protein
MQIHELNKKPTKINEEQVNEVDLVGPNSVFNVGRELGKQLVKNPRGVIDPTSIGIAKQNAAAASATGSAAGLAKQGYQVGGSAKEKTTPQQELQVVKTTPAYQQQVKNLAAQWKSVSPGIVATVKKRAASPEPALAEDVIDLAPPNTTQDAATKQTLSGLYAQRASGYAPAKYNVSTATGPAATPNPETSKYVNADLTIISNEFKKWASTKLAQVGVRLDTIASDPWTKTQLEQLLLKIATFSLANPDGSDTTNAAVEEFFNVAIASNLAMNKNSSSVTARTSGAQPTATAAGTQDDAALLRQSNIPLTPTQIETIGKAIRQDLKGSNVIRDTGSELLNALARSAGLQIGTS